MPTKGDCYRHLGVTFDAHLSFHRAFEDRKSFIDLLGKLAFIFRKTHGPPWPTFIYFFSNILFFNDSLFNFFTLRLYIDFIFLSLLIISIYFIGKKCFNKKTGLLAAFIISFYPTTYGLSRHFGLDIPITGMIALCLCLLLYSENFSKTPHSILLGISLGISTLIKLQGLFFLIFPFFYCIREIIKSENEHKKKAFLNLITAIIISGSLAFLYWGDPNNFKCLFSNFFQQTFVYYPFYPIEDGLTLSKIGIGVSYIPVFSLRSFTFYIIELARHTSLPLFILFIIAIVELARSREKYRLLFIFSAVIPYVVFTMISSKSERYILPVIIYIALITAWYVINIKIPYFRKILTSIIISYCLFVFSGLSWGYIKYKNPLFDDGYANRPDGSNPFFNSTNKKQLKKIVSDVQERLNRGLIVSIPAWGHGATDFMFFLYKHFKDDFIDDNIIFLLPEPPPDEKKPLYLTEYKKIWLKNKNKFKNYKMLVDLNKLVVLKKKLQNK